VCEGIYNRAEYAPQRREMLQAWADTLDALRADAQAAQGNDVARSLRVTRHLAAVLARKAKTSVHRQGEIIKIGKNSSCLKRNYRNSTETALSQSGGRVPPERMDPSPIRAFPIATISGPGLIIPNGIAGPGKSFPPPETPRNGSTDRASWA
jgi:hypothetical protein